MATGGTIKREGDKMGDMKLLTVAPVFAVHSGESREASPDF